MKFYIGPRLIKNGGSDNVDTDLMVIQSERNDVLEDNPGAKDRTVPSLQIRITSSV